jgi:enoyl-CoA hydratase/carnithine racemase
MSFVLLRLESDRRVSTLTLARPELLNAMSYEAVLELNRAVEAVRDDAAVRLLLIRGEGRAFCTGIDLKQLSAGQTPHAYYEQWERALRMLERLEVFVVCAMHGYALGGGLQLALASDIRVATEDCVLGLPAIQESIIPGLATLRLPRFVGLGQAKHLMLSGETIDGKRGREIGLVDHLVRAESFDEDVGDLVQRYLRSCSEGARQTKALLALAGDLPHAAFFEEYLRRQAIALASPDHEEALAAYLEKRQPDWS